MPAPLSPLLPEGPIDALRDRLRDRVGVNDIAFGPAPGDAGPLPAHALEQTWQISTSLAVDDDGEPSLVVEAATARGALGNLFPLMPAGVSPAIARPWLIPEAVQAWDAARVGQELFVHALVLDAGWLYLDTPDVPEAGALAAFAEADWEDVIAPFVPRLADWDAPVFLTGKVSLDATLAPVWDALRLPHPALPDVPFTACVNFESGLPVLTLWIPFGDGIEVVGLGFEAAVELTTPLHFSPQSCAVRLVGQVALDSSADPDVIAIEADLPLAGNDSLIARGEYQHRPGSSLWDALTRLDFLPSLHVPEVAVAASIELVRNAGSFYPQRVTFGVEVKDWKLFDGIITLPSVVLDCTVLEPLGDRLVMISFAADALLGSGSNEVKLAARGSFPSGDLSLGLASDNVLSLKSLLGLFGLSCDAAHLVIKDILIDYNVRTGRALLQIDVAGDWRPSLFGQATQLTLQNLTFTVARASPANRLGLSALLSIGPMDFRVTALRAGKDAWSFRGGIIGDIDLGSLLDSLKNTFDREATLPEPLKTLVLRDIGVAFDESENGDRKFEFHCDADFDAGGRTVDVHLIFGFTEAGGKYLYNLDGTINVGGMVFDLHFRQGEGTAFAATYKPAADAPSANVQALIRYLSTTAAGFVPPSLTIVLKDALLAFQKDDTGSRFVFGLDLGASVNLADLPLIGGKLPADLKASIDDLRVLVTSKAWTAAESTPVNELLALAGVPALGAGSAASGAGALREGVIVSGSVSLGTYSLDLALPVPPTPTMPDPAAPPPAPADDDDGPSSDGTKWFKVQKTIGPVDLKRLGVRYQDDALAFLFDMSLTGAGLTLSLDGLGAGSPLHHFAPSFHLDGIGLRYDGGGAVSVGGAFLKEGNDYSGFALIQSSQLTLSAIGSYAAGDHPSLFVYAVLDYPLGGPAFFFVTGLAAGFGYNRALLVPAVDKVAEFPLVQQVLGTAPPDQGPRDRLQKLPSYFPPAIGESFLAVGIKFNSFKIIDSFALLTVAFGTSVDINLLGISTLIVPPRAATPLAEVQIAFRASYDRHEGALKLDARVTDTSYILSRDCRLTGGYAFYSWFEGDLAGDFVQTLGGYHPAFQAPAHYPRVPRLAFNWRVNSELTIKGDMYYALTSRALMAGGHLEARWVSGDLEVYFRIGADFLISWKPYHYDAEIYCEFGVEYSFSLPLIGTVHISVNLGADLHLWGPEFSGKAHISLSVISFDIPFGARSGGPKPIAWTEFQTSFLPAPEKVCSISVKDGLVRKNPEAAGVVRKATDPVELGALNPKRSTLVINSVVPCKTAQIQMPKDDGEAWSDLAVDKILCDGQGSAATPVSFQLHDGHWAQIEADGDPKAPRAFGIGSMALKQADLTSHWQITVTRDDKLDAGQFQFVPILKRVPAGLWGDQLQADVKGPGFIENALCGFELRPASLPKAGVSQSLTPDEWRYHVDSIEGAWKWEPRPVDPPADPASLSAPFTEKAGVREALLTSLGLDIGSIHFRPGAKVGDGFLTPPQV